MLFSVISYLFSPSFHAVDAPTVITCPPDQIFTIQPNQGFVTFPQATATDADGIQPSIFYRSDPPGVAFDDSTSGILRAYNIQPGVTTITATAIGSGLNQFCIFTITITGKLNVFGHI